MRAAPAEDGSRLSTHRNGQNDMARPGVDAWKIRPSDYRWMRWTYGCTALMGLVAGMVVLFAPEKFVRKFIGFPFRLPAIEPITMGVLGSLWFAFGLLSLLGLRAPLRFLPVFLMQLIYKTVWFGAVFVPLWLQDAFPSWGWALAVGNAAWIVMDLNSIPWGFLLSKDEDTLANPSTILAAPDRHAWGQNDLRQSERRVA